MRRKMSAFWGVAAFCMLGLYPAAFAADVEAPPKPSELNWTRRPVPFDHQVHLRALGGAERKQCVECHHPVEGQAVFRACAAEGCHDNLNPRDTSLQSYYVATHKKEKTSRWSCVSCHTAQAGDDIARLKSLAGCKASVCHK